MKFHILYKSTGYEVFTFQVRSDNFIDLHRSVEQSVDLNGTGARFRGAQTERYPG